MKEVSQQEQAAMPPYIDNISHGDAIVQDNVLLDLVGGFEEFLFKSIGVKLAAVPFIVNGIKLAKKWPWKGAATASVLRTADCYKDALKIQKMVGGEIITISPILDFRHKGTVRLMQT